MEQEVHELDQLLSKAGNIINLPIVSNTPKTDVVPHFPDIDKREPYCFILTKNWIEEDGKKYKAGVYRCSLNAKRHNTKVNDFVCSPLWIEAETSDEQGKNHGIVITGINRHSKKITLAIPLKVFTNDVEVRGLLWDRGIVQGKTDFFIDYLKSLHAKNRMLAATRTGWTADNDNFVLPDEVIGDKASEVILQTLDNEKEIYTKQGTLEGWIENIGKRAMGNHMLTFSLSIAFSGALLKLLGLEGGGFHFFGESSTGKTTLLDAASSVWGGKEFKRSWKATANGMEGAALLFNDCLLTLDEISQCDPDDIGEIVYFIGNGTIKQRANKLGAARSVNRALVMVISTGERTVADAIAEGRHKTKAGQLVRMIDIPVIGTYGAFDELHGAKDGAAFSDELKAAAKQHHGVVGRVFLKKLIASKIDLHTLYKQVSAAQCFQTEGGDGQPKRVAARFALVALAGELATSFGLTSWREKDATIAAGFLFGRWKEAHGKGNDEPKQVLNAIADFIDAHGNSRFMYPTADPQVVRIPNRAGYFSPSGNVKSKEYWFLSKGFKEALHGLDFKRAVEVLIEKDILTSGKTAKLERVIDGVARVYVINYDALIDKLKSG